MLWIAFVLSLIDLCHSHKLPWYVHFGVVNCFRSFTYWPLSQFGDITFALFPGCELLSFFHLLTFVTVFFARYAHALRLWIAFVLSLIDLCHSFYVVDSAAPSGCELLSFFHLLTFVTVQTREEAINRGCELLSFFHLLTFVTVPFKFFAPII